jgi:lysophospholipase L1-like esterase
MSELAVNSSDKQHQRPSRLKDRFRRCWIFCCILGGLGFTAVVSIVGLDIAFGMWRQPNFSEDLQSIPYYASQPWTPRFEADQNGIASAKVEYQPFTVWRRPPYSSGTVNVNADGLRVVPGSRCEEGAPRIFFFGGSTMWGTSSPDEGTIPALFLREVSPLSGGPLCVKNFGESAWVSTQSVIALINAIQRKEIPDLVIFYEGANDLNWTFGNNSPYRHGGYESIAATFKRASRGRGQGRNRTVDLASVVRALAPNIATALDRRRQFGNGPSDRSPQGVERLANQAIDVYFANQQIVRALAREYGFRCHFFWQPFLIYDRKPLAEGESNILDRAATWAESFRPFAAAANARITTNQASDFTDLSGLFATTEAQLYTDMVHVTPDGNALVAHAMAKTLGEVLEELSKNHVAAPLTRPSQNRTLAPSRANDPR